MRALGSQPPICFFKTRLFVATKRTCVRPFFLVRSDVRRRLQRSAQRLPRNAPGRKTPNATWPCGGAEGQQHGAASAAAAAGCRRPGRGPSRRAGGFSARGGAEGRSEGYSPWQRRHKAEFGTSMFWRLGVEAGAEISRVASMAWQLEGGQRKAHPNI